jgi:DNA polymerase-3 subunit epsilon
MGKCLSPCNGSVSPERYAAVVDDLRTSLVSQPDSVIAKLSRRMAALSQDERFEDAASFRDRLAAFLRGAARTQRLKALTRCPEVVAARREEDGRWAVHVVRHGRLAAAGVIPPGAHAGEWVKGLRAEAETVLPGPGPTPSTTAEETEKILRWLESPGVRLVHVDGEWSCPVGGAAKHLRVHDAVNQSREDLVPFDDRRPIRPVHQPVR